MSLDPPKYLYKYGRLNEHSEELFSTPTMWFAPPKKLNDPFECRPWFTFDGNAKQIHERIASAIRKNVRRLSEDRVQALAASWFLEGRHLTSEFKDGMREDVHKKLAEEIGIYCLCETGDNILMWSHYARDHNGYCLQFEIDATEPFGAAESVNYCDSYPVVDFYNTTNEEQVDLIFLTKYFGWQYEREWRIIDHQHGPGARQYPPERLTGVIFGMHLSEDDRARIRAWIAKRGHPVRFYEAKRDNRQFKIDVVALA